MAGVHKKLAPSASKRWLTCPGSIKLSEGIPEKETVYAKEGTAAHVLAETSLKGSKDPKVYLGEKLPYDIKLPISGANAFTVTEEMIEAVSVYTDYVKQQINAIKAKGHKPHLFVETKVNMDWLIPESGGTIDALIYDTDARTVEVVDYKHGAGLAVYPEQNTQGMIYALGACSEATKAFDQGKEYKIIEFITGVTITIVQPRLGDDEPIKTWDIRVKDLLHWGHNVLVPGANAALYSTELIAGAHCRFCPALAICTKQKEIAVEVAKTDFEEVTFKGINNLKPFFLSIGTISPNVTPGSTMTTLFFRSTERILLIFERFIITRLFLLGIEIRNGRFWELELTGIIENLSSFADLIILSI